MCRQCTYALITILSKGNVQFTMIVLLFLFCFFLICERETHCVICRYPHLPSHHFTFRKFDNIFLCDKINSGPFSSSILSRNSNGFLNSIIWCFYLRNTSFSPHYTAVIVVVRRAVTKTNGEKLGHRKPASNSLNSLMSAIIMGNARAEQTCAAITRSIYRELHHTTTPSVLFLR